MKPFHSLLGASIGTHAADQLALATLPLTATLVLDVGPGLLGLLIAAQGAAWLIVSIPAGAWADRVSRRKVLIVALGLGLFASLVAVVAAFLSSPILLGLAAFVAASGTAVYVLTSISLLPSLVSPADLPRCNARLELARAVMTLGAPFLAGLLAQRMSPTWGYGVAALGAAVALLCVLALPRVAAQASNTAPPSFSLAIRTGALFVVRHPLLRDITLCAIFWNFAFFALFAVWAPYALKMLHLDPAHMGLAQSLLGVGLILGALAAPYAVTSLPLCVTLVFGPVVSVVGAALFLLAPRLDAVAATATGFFLIGFGPMIYAICQTTVRQLVTPAHLLGRVNATLQTTLYGMRPLGALAGGLLAAHAGVEAALWLSATGFVLSTLAMVTSPLARRRLMPDAVAA